MERKALIAGVLLLLVLVVAGAFRLYDLENYPPGLFPDEAANGEDALLILEGDTRPFYPRGNGREGLFFYLEALAIRMFGIGVWPLHLVSAIVGIASVAAVYWATRVWFGRLSGLLAALFMATNHWHVTMSRTGFRAILIPLFVALFTASVGATIHAVKKKQYARSYWLAALAGASFMGGFYTYIAYRVMVGVIGGITVLILLAALHPKIGFPHVQRYWKHVLVACLAGFVVFLPLLVFFVQEPDAFVGRAGQVSVFNEELQVKYGGGTLWGTLLFSTRETLVSFFAGDGDRNWRHNVAGFPLLNPLVAVLFLLGVAWTLRGTYMVAVKIFRGQELHLGMIFPYVLLLLGGMMLPVITTAEGLPHGLRSIGLVMPIFFLAGTAGSVTFYWFKRRIKSDLVRSLSFGLLAGAVILGAAYDEALYFFVARNDAEAHYAYRADLTQVADYINRYHEEQPEAPRPFLALEGFSLQTVHFLTAVTAHEYVKGDEVHPDKGHHLWTVVEPEQSHLTTLKLGEIIIFTQSTMFDADRYEATHQNIELLESRRNRFGEEVMRVYQAVGVEQPGEVEGISDGLDA